MKQKPKEQTAKTVGKARRRKRHWGLLTSFIVLVTLPLAMTIWYMSERAVDQYASSVAFTVRTEDLSSASDFLGGLGGSISGSSSSDADILYEFVRSQPLVKMLDNQLDLKSMYSLHHDVDPIFGLDPDGQIEDITDYWQRVVRVSYDAGSGLIEIRVLAFSPEDAKRVATALLNESSKMINDLSAIAREDATRYARQDLDLSLERLKKAREALTSFRIQNQIVDPAADIQGQMGLLNTLQAQLADALIELDLLNTSTRSSDPRIEQMQRRVDVIEARINEERRKFGVGTSDSGDETSYATTIAEFERLTIDREFAEQAYGLALSSFDSARAEANRQSRYLAAYISPTLAESAEYPQRPLIIFIVGLFSVLLWAIGSLSYYAVRDRR